jgi:hypothetical protein
MASTVKRYTLLPILAALAGVAFACGGGADGPPFIEGSPGTTIELAQVLRDAGLTVEEVGEVLDPLFGGAAFELIAGDEIIGTLEYADAAALEADADRISADGLRVTTRVGERESVVDIAFNDPPHYFRSEVRIVFYVGTDSGMLSVLQEAFGPQFVGQ